MAIEKPGLFTNLKKWREERGFTTPEWETYVKARNGQIVLLVLMAYVLGGGLQGYFLW